MLSVTEDVLRILHSERLCYEYGTQILEFWKEGFTDNNENLKKKWTLNTLELTSFLFVIQLSI
jgi:hypothetical protein